MSLPFAILGDLVPTKMLARFIGYSSLVFLVASVGGPILGGVFAEQLSWRLVFYINVPFGIVSLFLISRVPPRRPTSNASTRSTTRARSSSWCDHVLRADDELGWHPSRRGARRRSSASASRRCCSAIAVHRAGTARRRAGDPRAHVPHSCRRSSRRASTSRPVSRSGRRSTSPPRSCSTCAASIPAWPVLYVAPFMVGAVGGNLISGRRIGQTGRYRTWPIVGGVCAHRSAR